MELIGIGLRKVMGKLLRGYQSEEAAVLAWPVVCGQKVAARTRVVKFAKGCLTVEVPDNTWRTQLVSFGPRYVSAFAELLGPVVQEVEFEKQSAVST